MAPFRVLILPPAPPFYGGRFYPLPPPPPDGWGGFQPRHSNMITALVPGTMYYQIEENVSLEAAVSQGLAKVENGEVLILVDTAERPEEIDAKRAKRDADAAKEALLQKRSIQEYRAAQATLARAISRLRVKRHFD